jgi:hypothetical protein
MLAQASILKRAKDAVDRALPLLHGLADVDAIKIVVQKQMLALVEELGPPRVSRVGQIFRLLGGPDIDNETGVNADSIGGTLGTLRDQLGEQDLTNYRIIADSIISLAHTWFSVRRLGRRHGKN